MILVLFKFEYAVVFTLVQIELVYGGGGLLQGG